MEKTYIAIDLKSFYASVECVERGLDPLTTNLVVADADRTDKTICLAVSPPLKEYGIPGRARLFEVIEAVKKINALRKNNIGMKSFKGKSHDAVLLKEDPFLELDYIVAKPQMSHYIDFNSRIYGIYLKYIAPEDIHVYSIDEVFIDATPYIDTYKLTPYQFAAVLIKDVFVNTGITAVAGIGPNLYLAKIAMDIYAKHIKTENNGLRIAELDEGKYREKFWDHRPLTDFWRIGRGTARKLESHGMMTMGDIARMSVENEELLYKIFGINAELLIDHAWGAESCTMEAIKSYKSKDKTISTGQLLGKPYDYESAGIVVCEMADIIAFSLAGRKLTADRIVLTVCYDVENMKNLNIKENTEYKIKIDRYGRKVPESSHGTIKFGMYTSSSKLIMNYAKELYDNIIDKELLIRRIYISTGVVIPDNYNNVEGGQIRQLELFTDYCIGESNMITDHNDIDCPKNNHYVNDIFLKKEKAVQKAVICIRKKYGKNAIFKGMDLFSEATALERNMQIGGHRA